MSSSTETTQQVLQLGRFSKQLDSERVEPVQRLGSSNSPRGELCWPLQNVDNVGVRCHREALQFLEPRHGGLRAQLIEVPMWATERFRIESER
jgi:hypothetical protein